MDGLRGIDERSRHSDSPTPRRPYPCWSVVTVTVAVGEESRFCSCCSATSLPIAGFQPP